MTLKSARLVVQLSFVVTTAALTLYVAMVSFDAFPESVQFFGIVVMSITAISALLGIRNCLDELILGRASWACFGKLALAGLAFCLAVLAGGYVTIHMNQLVLTAPFFNQTQLFMGALLLASVIIAGWLHWGWALPVLVVASIVYFFFGNNVGVPLLSHPSYTNSFVMNYLTLSPDNGIFKFLEVLTDQLYFLILFGAVLVGVGAVRLFVEIGNAAGRRVSGGAAFPAIIASGVLGAILPAAVASTTVIGRVTIPTMKSAGYSPSMAGAIETLASTSGQLMPPILGLAAFIMAALINVPYITIALASFIPAVLYIVALVVTVISYAGRHKLGAMQVQVDRRAIWRLLPGFVIPFVVVLVMLMRYISPSLTGLIGIALAILIWTTNGQYRLPIREFANGIGTGLELVVVLGILVLLIGPLAQSFQTTGLSNNLGIFLASRLPHWPFLLLVIAAAVGIILGMGLPTAIAYVGSVLTMGPFLVEVAGIKLIPAHLFMFYFAVFSTITPPVAVSALAASKIANTSFWAIGGQAMKIAVSLFILPFVFAYNPVLVEFPSVSWQLPEVIALVVVVQCCFTCAQFGYLFRDLKWIERAILFLIGLGGFVSLLQADRGWWLMFALISVGAISYCAMSARLRPALSPQQ